MEIVRCSNSISSFIVKTKTKIRIALLSLILFGFLSYQLAISNTLNLRKEYLVLSQDQRLNSNVEGRTNSLMQREVYLDSVLSSLNLGSGSTQNSLLDFMSRNEEKNKIKVIDFNPAHSVQQTSGTLITYDIRLQGSFLGILKTLHELETNSGFGSLSHVYFVKSRNLRTKRSYLEANLLIEEYQ